MGYWREKKKQCAFSIVYPKVNIGKIWMTNVSKKLNLHNNYNLEIPTSKFNKYAFKG